MWNHKALGDAMSKMVVNAHFQVKDYALKVMSRLVESPQYDSDLKVNISQKH